MVIGDLHIVRMALAPHEANAELIVDANAVLSLSVSLQSFQAISRQDGQVRQTPRTVYHEQLSQSCSAQTEGRFPSALAGLPKSLRLGICEALDHRK